MATSCGGDSEMFPSSPKMSWGSDWVHRQISAALQASRGSYSLHAGRGKQLGQSQVVDFTFVSGVSLAEAGRQHHRQAQQRMCFLQQLRKFNLQKRSLVPILQDTPTESTQRPESGTRPSHLKQQHLCQAYRALHAKTPQSTKTSTYQVSQWSQPFDIRTHLQ